MLLLTANWRPSAIPNAVLGLVIVSISSIDFWLNFQETRYDLHARFARRGKHYQRWSDNSPELAKTCFEKSLQFDIKQFLCLKIFAIRPGLCFNRRAKVLSGR
jgi:hypothetical protein